MKIIVQKYGGSSVKNPELLNCVAKIVAEYREKGYHLVVVVSAQGDTTDRLLEKAEQISATPDKRAVDLLLATGELQSSALLAITLAEMGIKSVALSGIEAGIQTNGNYQNGEITSIKTTNIKQYLEDDYVVVVSGFQGVGKQGEYITLGRGGSDTTAAALSAALKAEKCQIYTDVEGIFTADPRLVPHVSQIPLISYHNMGLLAKMGAKVLHSTAVAFAQDATLPIEILSTTNPTSKTVVQNNADPVSVCGLSLQKGFCHLLTPISIPVNPLVLEQVISPLSCFEIKKSQDDNLLGLYLEGYPSDELSRQLDVLGDLSQSITHPVVRIAVVGDELPFNHHLIWEILECCNPYKSCSRLFTSRGCCWVFCHEEESTALLNCLHDRLIKSN